MITKRGTWLLKKYCREPIENIKGYREAVESEDRRYVCHHVNELTFTEDELKKMNMYYHRPASELIIMTRSQHRTWHNKWNGHPMKGRTGDKNPMYGRTGDKNPMYGRRGDKCPAYGRTGDKNPMYGRTREKHPNWKGDKVKQVALYGRAKKLYKAGQMTEEEFQPFREIWNEYSRQRREIERFMRG